MRVYLINDDDSAHYESRAITEVIPDAQIVRFEDAYSASRDAGRADLIVIDLSAVGSILSGPESCYSAVCWAADKHPGAPIIINSAVSTGFSGEVVRLVAERCPDSVVHVVDWFKADPIDSFKAILKDFAGVKPTRAAKVG